MGFLWDLMQQSQISEQRSRAASLGERVEYLERELHSTQQLLRRLIVKLEESIGEDVDGDGRIG